MAHPHRKDVEKLAPKMAEAVKGVLATQKASVSATSPKLDTATETSNTKAAVLPAITAAVGVGAARVASVLGTAAPEADADIAGAWAYKFADQLTTTTQGQLDALDDDATDDDVAALFDARSSLADDMVNTILSNAINSGAQNYAETLPADTQPTKTSVVTDDHPCTECESVTGESVPAATTFSNGKPNGAYHPGCMCTVDWSSPSTSRSARIDILTRLDADRLRLSLPPVLTT